MANVEQSTERDGYSSPGASAVHTSARPPVVTTDPEKSASTDKLILSEEDTLHHARTFREEDSPIYITFGPDDAENPRNWSQAAKWWNTMFIAFWGNVILSAAISCLSLGFDEMSSDLGWSLEIITLAALCMILFGGAIGPLFYGPLSERYGRKPCLVVSFFLLFIFQLPVALATNIETVIICRFFQGMFGSAPPPNSGGTIHDLWTREESGAPLSVYLIGSVSSPPLTLMVMGYVVQNPNLGWRWPSWIIMIFAGISWLLSMFTISESRHSVVLQKKAKRVQKLLEAEGIHRIVVDKDSDEREGLDTLVKVTLARPIRFLFTEPIIMFSAACNGFIFGLLYIFQGSFPLVFGPEGHGFNTGEQGLSFTGLFVGSLVGAACSPLQDWYYCRAIKAKGAGSPEARMWMARWAIFCFPVSLFWFAWTSYTSVPWIVPIIASGFFGFAFFIILLAVLSYVYDSYGTYSASALAAVLIIRNAAGSFPLFGTQMYEYLGYEWASSLLGFLSLLLLPIPFIYFYKGETLRWRSPYTREHFDQKEDLA